MKWAVGVILVWSVLDVLGFKEAWIKDAAMGAGACLLVSGVASLLAELDRTAQRRHEELLAKLDEIT